VRGAYKKTVAQSRERADRLRALSLKYAAGEFVPKPKSIKPKKRKFKKNLPSSSPDWDLYDSTPAQVMLTGWKQPAKDPRRQEYEDYMGSPEWAAFRQYILKERGKQCQRCRTKNGPFHIHHLHYRNFMHEHPEDVQVVCKPCHKFIHRRKNV
jgi:hypothetical protein